jgi:phenylacetate-CoA ligase
MNVFKLVFTFGTNWRNPAMFQEIAALHHTDLKDKMFFVAQQHAKLHALLTHARATTEAYTALPEVTDFEDFKAKVPLISKKELIANLEAHKSNALFSKVIISETSGTSGEGLVFPKDISWDTKNRAAMFRGYSWYDVNPWDRNGYFWGYNISGFQKYKTLFLDALQNRFRLFSYDEKSVRRFVKKLRKVTYLHGYSSMIYEVALMAKEMGFTPSDFPKLKMIKGTSEKIFPVYQTVVKEVFGQPIRSEYGAAESGIIAFECPQGHMHINEENVIVEQIDGEIVVTNLNSYSFPIIRYKLGDLVTVAPYSICTCGRQSDVILDVMGRVGKTIKGKNKNFPSLTLYYIFKNLALNEGIELQYQAFQNTAGILDFRFPISLTLQMRNLVIHEAEKYFKGELQLNLIENFEIHAKHGKLRDFISEI